MASWGIDNGFMPFHSMHTDIECQGMRTNLVIAPFEGVLQTVIVELLTAFNELVARALERSGCETATDLSEAIGKHSTAVTRWRNEIKGGGSPLLGHVLPLLEAAGVFAKDSENTRKDEHDG